MFDWKKEDNMKVKIVCSVVICVIACIALVEVNTEHVYLKEKPAFLNTCHRRNNTSVRAFDECLVQAFQNLFTNWGPGVANSKSIDPLRLSLLNLIDDGGSRRRSGPQLQVKVLDPVATGLSTARVLNVTMKANEYSFKMRYAVPNITIHGNYSALGQISLLQLDTFGEMMVEIENGMYTVVTKVQLHTFDDSNVQFFDIKALKFVINDIENVRLQFSNLFKDDALTRNTNVIFNEQWRVFFDIFKPRIEQTISLVLLEVFQSMFTVIPADYFVADVNKPAKKE